ncbi:MULTISPECIES: hypothetical protein [Streptomyces]|uniref:hypothetical protein n=1 Tax=Streptomyces TaxID=1883 RepID=UPI001C30331B|nr:hypothetical protein [Streptomyces sp. GbtcB7]
MTDPFAPPPETGCTTVTSERRCAKESAGGFFAATAAFEVVQALVFEPVSRLLPGHAHRVTALAGILAATLAHPLATRWLKRLPSSAPPQ